MDIRVAAAYIREVSKLDLPSEDVLRSCINAAQTLSRWAARSDVSEIEAAPVIMEAAKHVREIVHTSSAILSSPIKATVLQNLQLAYHDLRSFFFDDDEESEFEHMSEENSQDESSSAKEEHLQTKSDKELKKEHQNGSAGNSSYAKAKEQSDADYVACEKKAAMHLRILFCIIMVLFIVFSVVIVAIYAYVYHNHKKDFKLDSLRDAMYVQSAATNAVYAALWSTEVNVNLSKTQIFATLLHDLSFSRTEGDQQQTIFYDSQLPLIEFRGAQVNLRNHKSVSSVITPRLYGMLCRQNLTYPVEQSHDVGTVYGVYAILTPNECANDATASGIFQYSTGTIREPFPFVLNYRRDTAGRYVQYSKDYSVVAALTIDDNTLSEFVVQKDGLFGVQNVLSYMYGEWLLLATAWVAVIVIGVLCLQCVYLEIFTRVTFKAYRLAFAMLITATTAVGFALIIFVVAHYSEVNLGELLSACNMLISRCVVGVTKSSELVKNNATDTFFQMFFNETSNSGFLMSGDGLDVNPPSMQSVADKLNLQKIVREKRVLYSDKAEQLNLVSTYLPDIDKFYVRVTKSAGMYFVSQTVWFAIIGCILIFIVTLSYLHLSPLRRLCKHGSGSPFLRYTLHGHKVRFVFYIFLVVILVCMAMVYSSYRMFIMSTITEKLAEETMTILASFYHANNVVNYALNANDLPSTIIRAVFTRKTDTTKLASQLDIAYPESKQWPDSFYGSQLALSHLFTVVRNALSFATPFVNESSKTIKPQSQMRHMIATIDVNDTAAVVLERFPDSYSANEFGLTSKWIGVCIAIILLAVFIALSEWLYLQLWEKRIKHRHSEYIVVRVFIFALIVLSCTILIQFWVTESNVNSAITRFAHAELGTIVSSQVMLLFNYMQSTTQVTDMAQAKKLIYDFTSLISHAIGTSTNHYMRWFVLEDVDCDNCGTVGVIDAKGNVGRSFYLKQTINSLVPNCDVMDGGVFDPSFSNTQFSFCIQTVFLMINSTTTTNINNDQGLSRFYIMALRPYDSTVENNLRTLRVDTIGMAIAMTVILLILFALVGWWVLHTVNSHDFALYSDADITMLTHSELVEVSSIIKLTPYYYRLCWALALLLLCLSLVIFLTPISVVLQNIMYAITSPMVYISQKTQASEVITNATLMLKHFYYVSSISSTRQILNHIADVIGKSDEYEFVKESNKNDVLDIIAKTEDEIGELTEMEQYTFLGLFSTGYDSYYTERADEYAKYIKLQDNMLNSIDSIMSFVPSMVKYNVTNETKQAAVELIEHILHAREYLRKIYILDHISVNDDLVFTYSDDANSEWPFRNSNAMNADDLIAKSHAALNLLTVQMNKVLENITNYVVNVFPQSTETNLLQKKIKAVMKFTSGCTVDDSTSDFWDAQRTLMHEYKYIENNYMYIPLRREQEKYKQILSNTQNVLNARAGDEISTRYYDDLNEIFTTKRPLENTRFATGMEQTSIIERNKEKLLPLFLITIVTYCVLLLALMSCYCSMQASVQKIQRYFSGTDELTQKQNDQGSRELSQKVQNSHVKKMNLKPVFILFVISILIIIPYSITYVTISDTIGSMSKEIDVNALGINMIASAENLESNLQGLMKTLWDSYQRNKLKKIDNYLKMTVSLSNYFIQNVKVRGMNDPLTRACFVANNTANCNVLASLTSLSQMVRALVYTVQNEAKVCSIAVPPNERWTDAGSRTNYSMTILESMSPDDLYSSLAPYAVTSSSSTNASAKIYNYLKQQVLDKLKEASDSDAITLLQKYVDDVDILCGISDADLKVWHTVLAANRKDAAPIAVQFADFKQLVGSETLNKLSSADVQSEVTEIINAYANLVKIANSSAEVIALFTPPCNQTEPDSFTSLEGSYIGTAMYACKVSNIITEQSFRELYAYNRQLVPVSGSHLPKTPIVKLMASITNTVRGIITDHITPSAHTYSIVPAVDYPWVWHDEVKTFTSKTTSGMDMSTLITLTQLLLTLTFAISIAGVILTGWLMEIV